MFSPTLIESKSAPSWNDIPNFSLRTSRSRADTAQRSSPSISTDPASGFRRPTTCLRRTLLPIPDCPRRTSDSPFSTVRSRWSRTTFCPERLRDSAQADRGDFGGGSSRAQNSTFVRKKSAMRIASEPRTTAAVVERADALRAALRVVAGLAADHRKKESEYRRLDEAGGQVVHVQELERVVHVDDGVRAEVLDGHEITAEDARHVREDDEHRRHDDPGEDARHEEVLDRVRREGDERVDLFRDTHRPDLGRHRAPRPARHHEARQDGRQLAEHRERDDRADVALGVKPLKALERLEREDAAGEERRQKDDGHRVHAHAHDLLGRHRDLVRRHDEAAQRLAEELEEAADSLEKAQDAPPDRFEHGIHRNFDSRVTV